MHSIITLTLDTATCDKDGADFLMCDIKVTIPRGAIPDGVTAHLEMGVAMYGPFKFPENHQQVSPILRFCIKEDIELLLPIVFTVPHIIKDITRVKLSFAKANHLEFNYDPVFDRRMFSFKTVNDSKSGFTSPYDKSGYGHLSTKHSCFLCIQAETRKDLALEKGYCLHTLIEKVDSSTYRILLICTYFLQTCFEVCNWPGNTAILVQRAITSTPRKYIIILVTNHSDISHMVSFTRPSSHFYQVWVSMKGRLRIRH